MKQAVLARTVLATLSLSPVFLAPQDARADWFWRRPAWRQHHDHREYATVVVLPAEATPVAVGETTYYYCQGRYYKRGPWGYGVVPAPMGAVVPSLPEGHRTIVIAGITYHEYGGVYYKGGPAGYTVVPIYTNSATPAAAASSLQGQPVSDAGGKTPVVVNVPNKNGSYTPITLQSAGNGMYIGPQGEVYPNRPEMGQLQAMYGK